MMRSWEFQSFIVYKNTGLRKFLLAKLFITNLSIRLQEGFERIQDLKGSKK
jgi:hypothetical protein